MTVSNGQDNRLSWRQPRRECSAVVLDKNPNEAFERAQKCTVDHEWTVLRPILTDVGQIEPLRQVEINLNGRALPPPTKCVNQLQVNLRAIENGLTFGANVFQVVRFQGAFENGFSLNPALVVAEVLAGICRVPNGEFNMIIVKTERLPEFQAQIEDTIHFGIQLVRSAEDV